MSDFPLLLYLPAYLLPLIQQLSVAIISHFYQASSGKNIYLTFLASWRGWRSLTKNFLTIFSAA